MEILESIFTVYLKGKETPLNIYELLGKKESMTDFQKSWIKEYEEGLEYPICMSSVYTKRGFKAPKNVKEKCKKYY